MHNNTGRGYRYTWHEEHAELNENEVKLMNFQKIHEIVVNCSPPGSSKWPYIYLPTAANNLKQHKEKI